MPIEQFANNYSSTLNGAINSSATSLVVASATGAPTSGPFRLLIGSEIIIVGAVSGTTFSSLTRGAEGTTAASHSSGATVTSILTAGALRNLIHQHSYIGYNAVGGSQESVTTYRQYQKKITLTAAGVASSIGAYVRQTTDHAFGISVAIMTDVSGVPGEIMAVNQGPASPYGFALQVNTPTWLHKPIGLWLDVGDYWLVAQFDVPGGATLQLYYDGSGADHFTNPNAFYMSYQGRWGDNSTTRSYSIRADFMPA